MLAHFWRAEGEDDVRLGNPGLHQFGCDAMLGVIGLNPQLVPDCFGGCAQASTTSQMRRVLVVFLFKLPRQPTGLLEPFELLGQ